MKLITMALVMGLSLAISTTAFSENRLDLFADAAGTQCELTDNASGVKIIYVFLTGTEPASGVEFAAPRPACWGGATWVGDIFPGPRGSTGNSQGNFFVTLYEPGDAIGYCKTPPVWVCGVVFFTTGAPFACCEMRVTPTIVPPPFVPSLAYHNCVIDVIPMSSGQKVVINPNESCRCNQPLATESTTWGRVKSLYR